MSQIAAKSRKPKPAVRTVAGTTSDGVVILMPTARPKHFTYDQVKKTIDSLKRSGAADPAVNRGLRTRSTSF